MAAAKDFIREILAKADVRTDGERPHDLAIHDERFYKRVLTGGILGLGESYMDGWWDCEDLASFTDRAFRAELEKNLKITPGLAWHYARARLLNRQSKRRAHQVGEEHYDRGNELFEAMLDPSMQYSCAYWKDAGNVEQAQKNKMRLIARKLKLAKGMRVLDIGCGWGGLARYLAEDHGVSVLGVTISNEQAAYAREFTRGLDVEVRVQDYRAVDGDFDRVVSVGMFEHVGHKNYRDFFEIVARCLSDQGLLLLHTIGSNTPQVATNPWTEKYIFPNSMLPSPEQISRAARGLVKLEDWHNFGPYYDNTLRAWNDNFQTAWARLKDSYSERFKRMWEFYLLTSAGAFRARQIQLWQVAFSKGRAPLYESVR